jgi:hypothetical protein
MAIRHRVYKHGVGVHYQGRRRMVEEIIGRLPELIESQLGRLEEERRHRASSAGERQDAAHDQEDAVLPVKEVLEYRPHEEGSCNLSYATTLSAGR